MASTFVVISFDYENTSTVRLHAITTDSTKADDVYEHVRTHQANALVELLQVPTAEYVDLRGHSLFWGDSNAPNVTCIATNNTPS